MATKSDDCYFFYYSSCTKGDSCPYRHCAEALGNETVCALWRDGRCYRAETCRFRHMEITKDRSQIYCYWETQPGGCRKPHCVFKHRNMRGADALTTAPEPLKTSTPDPALVMKTLPQLDAPDVGTPSPKIEPIVFNPFEEDSDRESVGIVSPKKAVNKPVSLPPAKTGKNKLTKTVPDEDEGLGFEIKSLDKLKSEKIAKAKQILHEADKLVTSQSVSEPDAEDSLETNPKISSPHRVSAIERLGEAVLSKPVVRPEPTPVVRRVIESNVDDEDSNGSEAVAEDSEVPKLKRIAVLKEDSGKAESKPVSRRVNINKGRRIIIADDEVKTIEKPATTVRKVSPKSGVLSRIGSQAEPAPAKRRNIKARLGNQEATKTRNILSRLGLVGQREESASPTDTTSLDDLPGTDSLNIRKLERERAKLAARLKLLEEEAGDSTGDEEAPSEIGIKSLEDIQREKALESMKQNRLKKAESRPKAKQVQETSKESRPTGVKKRVLTTRRSGKQELQIYKPPAAKLKEAETSSLKERLGRRTQTDGSETKRKAAPEQKVSPTNRTRQGEDSENVPRKKSGWGVKTYSEIMQEKQQRLAAKQNSDLDKSSEQSNRPSKKFTPIVFDEDEKPKTETKVPTAKRKFAPVVFDLDDKEETKAKDPPKKFKSITAPQSPPQPVVRRTFSKEESEKTTPSPRRQLSRQQSNKSVTQDTVTTTTTTTARKLKRRSSSQISNPDADSTTTKVRRRSSGASRKSIGSEKLPVASREDSLDLLDDDEFGDLFGDMDIENTSALHVKNDDDLLQEMEELLA